MCSRVCIFSHYIFLCYIKTFAHAVVIMLAVAENHLLLVNRTFLMKYKIVENSVDIIQTSLQYDAR